MRLSIEIPDDAHRELKAKAAREGTTISEVVRLAVMRYLNGNYTVGQPAKTRPVAISKADQAKGRTRK